MVDVDKRWFPGWLLRGAGLGLLASSWLLISWLFRAAGLRPHGHPSPIELGAATIGFLCFSAGAGLTMLGTHIFDRVQVSERWAKRSRLRPGDVNAQP